MEIDFSQLADKIKQQPQYVLIGSGLIAIGIILVIIGAIMLL